MNKDSPPARRAAHRPRAIVESAPQSPRQAALIVGGALLIWLLMGVTLALFIVGPR